MLFALISLIVFCCLFALALSVGIYRYFAKRRHSDSNASRPQVNTAQQAPLDAKHLEYNQASPNPILFQTLLKRYYFLRFNDLKKFMTSAGLGFPNKQHDFDAFTQTDQFKKFQEQIDTNINNIYNTTRKLTPSIRGKHGPTHACRSALLIPVIINLYAKFAPQELQLDILGNKSITEDPEMIFLIMMGALLHDAGNLDEVNQGTGDPGRYLHAMLYYHEMIKRGFDKQKVTCVAKAMQDKEDHLYEGNIVCKLIAAADAIEIMRIFTHGQINELRNEEANSIYQFLTAPNDGILEKKMIQDLLPAKLTTKELDTLLISHLKVLIEFQKQMYQKSNECTRAENCFSKVEEVFKEVNPQYPDPVLSFTDVALISNHMIN